MNREMFKQPLTLVVAGALILITFLSLLLRIIPVFSGNTDVLSNVGMDDPTYHLRLVEQCVVNFPQYAWFDPMTYFPQGQPMHWGPLFTVISSAICLLLGATTRTEIISVCLFIPCVVGALLVPVVYYLVKMIADWKAGLISALFIGIFPGQIFLTSFYGYFDHHVCEVLFGTLFCLSYIYSLIYCRQFPVDITNRETWKIPALLGLISGIIFASGLSLMPTMLLFALLVGIFTPVWFIIQRFIGHLGASALVVNTVTFLVAITGFFIIGVHAEGGLNYYTLGHPIVYGLMIVGTWVLFCFSYILRNRSFIYYILALISVSILGIILLSVISPDLYNFLLLNATNFFGQEIHWNTIQEARPWSFADAWGTFQYSLILYGIGIIVLIYRLRRELCPSHAFILTWSVLIMFATIQHIRYEYYLAVPAAILGGISIAFAIDLVQKSRGITGKEEVPHHLPVRGKQADEHRSHHTRTSGSTRALWATLSSVFLILVIILGVLFLYNSLGRDIAIGSLQLNPDWREATEWMNNNTPELGVDYNKIYLKDEWQPPVQSYGVMSWWDYGHIITYLGKRAPNANPFQNGVSGEYGSARFFMTTNESEASGILDKLKTRYVITDFLMDTTILWAMATWDHPDVGASPYQQTFIIPDPDNPNTGQNFPFFMEPYYRTMVSRLHNLDGSMKDPGQVHYVEYMKPEYTKTFAPVIVNGSPMMYPEAVSLVNNFNQAENPQYNVTLVNYVYTDPLSPVSALRHFRLVHESPTRASPETLPDIRYVKIFEYVPGAVIAGEGIIEIPVVTNTGRQFTYKQESVNGTFTVPYPTGTKIGDVTTTGPYRVASTGREYTVTEDQVQQGAILS